MANDQELAERAKLADRVLTALETADEGALLDTAADAVVLNNPRLAPFRLALGLALRAAVATAQNGSGGLLRRLFGWL